MKNNNLEIQVIYVLSINIGLQLNHHFSKTHLDQTHTHYTDLKTDPPDHTKIVEPVLTSKSKESYFEPLYKFIFNYIWDT